VARAGGEYRNEEKERERNKTEKQGVIGAHTPYLVLPPDPKKGQSLGIRANRRPNKGFACEIKWIRQQMLYWPVPLLRLATLEVQGHRINSGAEAHFQLHSSTANLVAGQAVDTKAASHCALQASVQASRLQIPLVLHRKC
jgi:hypothetical protein